VGIARDRSLRRSGSTGERKGELKGLQKPPESVLENTTVNNTKQWVLPEAEASGEVGVQGNGEVKRKGCKNHQKVCSKTQQSTTPSSGYCQRQKPPEKWEYRRTEKRVVKGGGG
jgi:hypothetical protein